jgi:hypothetical protein
MTTPAITEEKASDIEGPLPAGANLVNDGSSQRSKDSTPPFVASKDIDAEEEPAYGWICVVAVFCINAHTWGLNSAYGVFLAHYIADQTFAGATRLDYAFVGGLSISQAMLLSPLATACIRLYGTRNTLFIGVFFETLSFIGASFATRFWQILLSQGICFGWGMGFLFTASGKIRELSLTNTKD